MSKLEEEVNDELTSVSARPMIHGDWIRAVTVQAGAVVKNSGVSCKRDQGLAAGRHSE